MWMDCSTACETAAPRPRGSERDMRRAEAWSREENEAAVADYFDMWAAYLRRESYSKAEHCRRLERLLGTRSKGAIEKKHGNISAILHELWYPSLPGYQPYGNYQLILRDIVATRLPERRDIIALVAEGAERAVVLPPVVDALSAVTDEQTARRRGSSRRRPRPDAPMPGRAVNYLELQARNSALGRAGEELVLQYEQQRLSRAGRESLAARVQHVAATQGASAGFDVLSFEESGEERLIEVKTTTWGLDTPFYVTAHERRFSKERADRYHLYRLFDFRVEPKPSTRRLILRGPLPRTCHLLPSVYRATIL